MSIGAGYLISDGTEQLFGWIKQIESLLLVIILVMLARWWYQHLKVTRTPLAGEKHV